MKSLPVAVLFVLLIAGCATSRESGSIFSTGYNETRIARDVYVIRYNGSTMRSRPEVADGLMLRAAQLTQRTNAKYFAIVGLDETAAPGSASSERVSLTSGSVYGLYGIGGGGPTRAPRPVKTPRMMIRTFDEMPADMIVSNARNVERAILEKYDPAQSAPGSRGS